MAEKMSLKADPFTVFGERSMAIPSKIGNLNLIICQFILISIHQGFFRDPRKHFLRKIR
jgi:hypothetical protein